MMDKSENGSKLSGETPGKTGKRDPVFRDLGRLLHTKAREKGIPIE